MTKEEYMATLSLTSELKAAYSHYLEDEYKDYLYMKHKYDAELAKLQSELSQIQLAAKNANNRRKATAARSGRNSPEELSNSENATGVRETIPEKKMQIEESVAEYAQVVKDGIAKVKDHIQRSENSAKAIAARRTAKGGRRRLTRRSKGTRKSKK